MTAYRCAECDVEFFRNDNRSYRYCSRSCFYEAQRNGRIGGRGVVQRDCGYCGAKFDSLRSAGARQSYCSRSCQAFDKARSDVRQMTVAEAAYLAGIVDGEGTIVVSDRRPTRPKSTRPTIILSVSGCYEPMHEWIIRATGAGTMRKGGNAPGHIAANGVRTNRQNYAWRLTSLAAVRVLEQIEPYMIEKRARAQRALRCAAEGYSVLDAEALSPAA